MPPEMLNNVAEDFIKNGDFESGIFWLEKEDFYAYIAALVKTDRHKCALGLLKARNNDKFWIRFMMARCYSSIQRCTNALEKLSTLTVIPNDNNRLLQIIQTCKTEAPFLDPYVCVSDALFHKGCLLEYSGHVDSTLYFSYSLICNPLKFSAARKLFEDELLALNEAVGLIEEICKFNTLTSNLPDSLMDMALGFYNNYLKPDAIIHDGLFDNSWDVRRWKAQKYLNRKNSTKALDITSSVMIESCNQEPLTALTHAIGLYQSLSVTALQLFSVEFPMDNNNFFYSRAISMFINALYSISVGMPNDAHSPIQKAVSFNWNSSIRLQPWSISIALLFLVQGYCSWNAGDNDNALASFISAADASPSSLWAWFCVGVLHSRQNLYDLALPNLTEAYKISTRYNFYVAPLVVNEIACCLYYKKSYQSARKYLEKLIDSKMRDEYDSITKTEYLPVFYLNLAHIMLKLGQIDLAFDLAHRGLSFNCKSSPLMRLIGYLSDFMGYHEEAQLMYHRSLLLSPQLLDLIPKNSDFLDYSTIPPETNYRHFRQQDVFCVEMLKLSASAQGYQILSKASKKTN